MPVVATSAYNTAGQITALVRSLLNDAAGNLFTDAVLLPYANSAYRKVQRALANIQSGTFLNDDVLLVVSAVSSRGLLGAGVDHRRDCAAEPTAHRSAGAAEVVGTPQLLDRRFRGDDRSDQSRRPSLAGAGRRPRILGVARGRTLFHRRDPGYADPAALSEDVPGSGRCDESGAGAQCAGGYRLFHRGHGVSGARLSRRPGGGTRSARMRSRTCWFARRSGNSTRGDDGGRIPGDKDMGRWCRWHWTLGALMREIAEIGSEP